MTWLSLLSLALATYPRLGVLSSLACRAGKGVCESVSSGELLVLIQARLVASFYVAECWWRHAWLAGCIPVLRSWEDGIQVLDLEVAERLVLR